MGQVMQQVFPLSLDPIWKSGNYGVVLQDGGTISNGFINELAPDHWDEVAIEFFMTNDD